MKTMIIPISMLTIAVSLSALTSLPAQENIELERLPAVEKSLQKNQSEMRAQLDRAQQQLGNVQERVATIVRRGGENAGPPLVIRSSGANAKTQANLEEDLAVMSRILDKAAQGGDEDRPRRVMGINVLYGPGSNPVRSLYLEGYGSLFLLNVSFPLLPPPTKPEAQKEEPQRNSTWEEARREVYGQHRERKIMGPPAEEYSEDKVKELKDGLLEGLKNSPNIRDLLSDESITVCVFGGAPAGTRFKGLLKRGGKAPTDLQDEFITGDRSELAAGHAAMMTIRVKKSDAEAFAKGKLDLEGFRKKADITTTICASDGGKGGGGFGGGFSFGFGGEPGFGQRP